ncbi:MAG: glutamine phosphoribosylpyrophosphate amidotransferase, partial [Isosphaeraceae bacterium]|nr:glutamine phosphoribosylpyrophosphate amidotransferase [Isosphaeraceae bacterium]
MRLAMCGIVGLLDKRETQDAPDGRIVLTMLEALACRGPDGAGAAMLRSEPFEEAWTVRIAPADPAPVDRLKDLGLGRVERIQRQGDTLRFRFFPAPEVTAAILEQALGAAPGVLEVLGIGLRLDLVKHDGSPAGLERVYQISAWHAPAAIGHTRMSTESRIDLSHSQPFWAHGVPDLATVHNGHIT